MTFHFTRSNQLDDVVRYQAELNERLHDGYGPADLFWPETVIYLSGAHNRHTAAAQRDNLGLLLQPGNGYVSVLDKYHYWAADNGCFTTVGFDERKWFEWTITVPKGGCLFVSAPDIVGDCLGTWERSKTWLPLIRRAGHLAALVAQDGMEHMDNLPEMFEACDVLFLGGSTEWKLGPAARRLTAIARRYGLWVHMGRVNSWKRIAIAQDFECDSADGTFLAFGPDKNWPKLESWLDRLTVGAGEPMIHSPEIAWAFAEGYEEAA